jgi:hypothetical protein
MDRGPTFGYGGVQAPKDYRAPNVFSFQLPPNPILPVPGQLISDSLEYPAREAALQAERPIPQMFPLQAGTLPEQAKFAHVSPDEQVSYGTAQGAPAPFIDPRRGIKPHSDFDPNDFAAQASQTQPSPFNSNAGLMALLSAGLGILANNTGHYGAPGPAIGKGGMMGLSTFLGLGEQERNEQFRRDQLAQQEALRRGQFALSDRANDLQERRVIAEEARLNKPKYEYRQLKNGGLAILSDGKLQQVVEKPEDLTEMALSLAKTAEERAYAQADPPGFIEFKGESGAKLARAKAGASNISFRSYDKKEGDNLADQMDAIQKAGLSAGRDIQKYERLGSLLGQIRTGKFKGTITDVKAAAKSLGFDLTALGVSDDVAPAQAAQALSRELALELRNPSGGAGMPGALSDADRQYLQSMVPSIESDPDAWPQMIDAYKALKNRDIEVGRLARQYTKKNGGRLDYGFFDELDQYSQTNPLFKKQRKQLRTGTYQGKKVIQYDDGSVEYAQ